MLIDRYMREDVFAQVPELAAEIDPILKKLDALLDDDHVYRASSAVISAGAISTHWCMGDIAAQWKSSYAC
jgi:hypothetical protein